MALVNSLSLPPGTVLPAFTLEDAAGKSYTSDDLVGETGLLVVFTCNHCPYAKAVWPRLIRLAQIARDKGINTVAINPNIHPNYPDDSPEGMRQEIERRGIDFPYLVDETQQVAKDFQAQCTPDIYLFDSAQALVYHGRIDDNWQDESQVNSEELKEAIEALAAGEPINPDQKPSMGCSIKWK